jgi:predicted RNA-binding Zn-ribbon protein involved in translation (DUF1610 family)
MSEHSSERPAPPLTQCPKCAAHLDPHWDFCPHCAAANPAVVHAAPVPRKHENSPARNASAGFFFGVIIAAPCLILGGMLCCTLLGAFLGVPMIILGIFAPLLGSLLGFNELKSKCPWCGTRITSIFNHTQDFSCPACSHMIAIRNHEMRKVA